MFSVVNHWSTASLNPVMAQAQYDGTQQNNIHESPRQQANMQQEKLFGFSDAELVASPVTLPCGRVLPNRLVKVAMYEHLATFSGGPPNQYHISLYSKWARGGWGMIVTGNCQISSSHLSLGRDITFPHSKSGRYLDAFRALSAAMHSFGNSDIRSTHGTLAIIQLSHSGRQSPRFLGGRLGTFRQPVSPSCRPVGDDTREGFLARIVYKIMFQTPRMISRKEIEHVIERFIDAAKLACETGFDGVQLHAAHGYILSQFLSPKLNTCKDEYSKPLLLIQQIVTGIRAVTPASFVLGIKLNAGDYVTGSVSEEVALEHVRQIALLGVDFIEISGGDYENPSFMAATTPRQAFFSSFSRRVVQNLPTFGNNPSPLIMLTGALRTPSQFSRVLRQKHAHLLGVGRLSVLCPDLPHRISPSSVSCSQDGPFFPLLEPTLFTPHWFPRLLGAGVGTAWYIVGMRRIAAGIKVDTGMGSLGALFWMWAWAGPSGFTSIHTWILLLIGPALVLVIMCGKS